MKKSTNFLDKNGKVIHEGDTVIRYCPDCSKGHEKGEAMFMNEPGKHIGWIFRDYKKEKTDTPLIMYTKDGRLAPLEIIKE